MAIRSANLPVFQEELVDGGLQVTTQNVTSDKIVVVGFHATGFPGSGSAPVNPNTYINTPLLINRGDFAEFIFGTAPDGSTITQAVYELSGAGSNTIAVVTLGAWGTATFTDPVSLVVYPLFVSNGPGYDLVLANYYRALDYTYDLLANYKADIIYVADAYAFDRVTPQSGRPTTFAYQGMFKCYDMSSQNNECRVTFNVRPSVSGTLQAVSTYIGTAPTLDPVTGLVSASGTGLLGIQEMAGAPSGFPGYTILPGFYASNFDLDSDNYGLPPLSESEIQKDRKGNRIDIGKYADIVAEEPTYANGAFASDDATTYNGLGGAAYAGLVSTLVPHSAPTNKPVPGISALRYAKSIAQLDALTAARYVTFRSTNRGILVTDAPTAARSTSDYARLQVMRIVNATMKMVRLVADPYIGEPNSATSQNALHSAIDAILKKFVAQGALRQYDFSIVASDADRVLGNMNIYLTLVPEFEIRKINAVVVMKANI